MPNRQQAVRAAMRARLELARASAPAGREIRVRQAENENRRIRGTLSIVTEPGE